MPIFLTREQRGNTGVLTQPTVTTTSSVIAAADPARVGLVIHNTSGRKLFVAFAATASAVIYTVELSNGAVYEMPKDFYTGVVSAVTSSGSGTIAVTEITE